MNTILIFFHFLMQKKRALIISGLSLLFVSFAFSSITDGYNKHENAMSSAHHEEEHEEKIAELNDAQLESASIETAQVGTASIRETIALYGTIEANGDHIQHINARYPGLIKSVRKKMGDSVNQDEVLATIESNDSLRTYSISAAFNGVIAERNANSGEHTSDKSLFVVADLSSVWVDVAVFPRDMAKIHTGQSVRITNPANNLQANGNIIAMGSLGTSNQTINARVLLDNPERQWTPGLFVNAEVTLSATQVKLAIRNDALQNHDGKAVVFVKSKHGFVPRPIKCGRTDGEMSEVISGLTAGEIYATKNSFIIKAELGKDGVSHED